MPDILITPSSGNIRFSQLTTDNSANISLSGNNLVVSSLSGILALSGLNGVTNNGIPISTSGHNHISSDITNFNSSVSGLVSGIYAPLSNPAFIGIPTVPTATTGTNTNQAASTAFVRSEISNLVGSAPSTLDTLNELATALGNDANFSTTVTNSLANKANLSGAIFTGSVSAPSGDFTALKQNGTPVSISGHIHTSSDITDFNSSVSGLLPVKDIVAGTGISISSSSGVYTVNSTVSGVAEAASLVTTVFNKTASTINKGSVVYIDGGQGDQPTIQLAIGANESGSSKTYGIVQNNIPSMSLGKVVVAGALTSFNTDQFNPTAPIGDVNGVTLWLSPSISGAMTTTKPSAPYHMVSVGTIVRTHQNEGVIEVKIQNGFELEELHNVAISGVTSGQFLQYNSASGLWVPSSSGNFSTLQVNGTGVSINGHTHTSSEITNFNSSVSGLVNGIYAPLNSPNFSGIPTVPTATTGTNTNQAASTAFVRSEISNLVDSAPSTLDTLNELAAALGDDPNFATTVTNLIGNKVNKSGDTMTGTLIISPTGAVASGLIVSPASETNLQNVLTIDTNNYLTIESNNGSTITTENNDISGWILNGCEVNGIGFFSSLQLNGTDVSVSGHTHSSSDITNFNTGVSGLLPSVTGSGYVSSSFSNNIYTISVNGLQPSGNYSIVGHTHTASNITDFNSSVSGLLPTISNALNNRLLTSTGTSVGINAEANLTFDGSILSVIGQINIDDITLNTNIISTNTTNTDLILKPNGNGSLIADNAGNPRGIYSNDFQRERTSISGVAAGGYNVICGGSDNRTSNSYSIVCGGQTNTASNAWTFVGGGDLNISNGNRSVICGGGSNTSSGQSSTIGGGSSNQSTGAYSIVPGGFRAKATRQGELSHAGGYFNTIGDAQHTILIARRLTTDATADVVLTLNGLAPVSTNILNIPAQTMWTFGIKLSAYNVTNNEAAWWIFRGGIKRNNANSTVLVGSLISESGSESSLSTATATVVADDTNEALEIRVTGVSGKSIRWVAVADISQVSYGTP